jgi:hypothetical protein
MSGTAVKVAIITAVGGIIAALITALIARSRRN